MRSIKDYTLHIIFLLMTIIGVMTFLLVRSFKKNVALKADMDLTIQKESSKVVDEKVKSAQTEIDTLGHNLGKPVNDEFWKEYTKDDK